MLKQISLSFLFAALFSLSLFGQADDPKAASKNFKSAKKELGKYQIDQQANSGSLEAGIELIEDALANDEVAQNAAAWIIKGQIYNEIGNRDLSMPLINPDWEPVDYSAGMKAYEAFDKALSLAEKKFEKSDALEGMFTAVQHLNNKGIEYYNAGDFQNAFTNFQPILGIHQTLVDNETPSPLDDQEKLKSQMFIHAFTALKSGTIDEAETVYTELLEMGNPEPNVYEGLYELYSSKGDMAKAEQVLFDGVKQYPEDTGLLFAQINHYLKLDKKEELLKSLEDAIEKEPDNVSLYATLGNVHEQLYNTLVKDGKNDEAQEHFDEAIAQYNKAVEINPEYVAAIYSIGALFYNVAANKTNDLNELANDYSKEGTAKYEKLKVEIEGIFDQSLPYFKKAEQLDPNDTNTLIALKEIYARKNDFDTSNIFKDRLENVQNGGSNDSSYFKNN